MSGPPTIFSGNTVPSNTIGSTGDYFLLVEATHSQLVGPKTATGWGAGPITSVVSNTYADYDEYVPAVGDYKVFISGVDGLNGTVTTPAVSPVNGNLLLAVSPTGASVYYYFAGNWTDGNGNIAVPIKSQAVPPASSVVTIPATTSATVVSSRTIIDRIVDFLYSLSNTDLMILFAITLIIVLLIARN